MVLYVDTSALVKLVRYETETPAMVELGRAFPGVPVVTSVLTRCELLRAVRRADPAAAPGARAVLAGVRQIALTPGVLDAAARLDPPSVRSLDAIHLATAQSLVEDLVALVTYDERQRLAATGLGLPTLSPI